MGKGRVAVIGTGGTISAIGRDVFDLQNYDANGIMLDAAELLASCPMADGDPDCYAVPFSAISSTAMGFTEWRKLALLCHDLVAVDPDLTGIVITHGTATLEETAFFLHLTVKMQIPVVLTGAMRPWNGLSSDAALNLRNAIRVAACPQAAGLGVLVVMNEEIHSARDVTKCSTARLNAFRSPHRGPLGQADPDQIVLHRRPLPDTSAFSEFSIDEVIALPRVDILFAYAGGDDFLARAAIAAGAKGIISAGFAPGETHTHETHALREAVAQGIVVVQSTRAGAGRVPPTSHFDANGFVSADDLPPHKARILLALALTQTHDRQRIDWFFRRH